MAINQENVVELQQIKFDLFKTQDPEVGRFDVIFEVDGKLLYAHRNMLNLISDTFDAMLSDRWMKNKDEPIKIKDYSYNNFYQFVTFLYSGQCQLNDSNIFSMVDIAEFYGVALFKAYCDKYLATVTITTDNVFPLIELADKYSMVQLKSSAHRFITENFQIFADSGGFLNARKSIILEICASIKNAVKQEDLFLAIFIWSEMQAMDKQVADPKLNLNDQIKAEFSDFLPSFHFDKMELQFLCEFVVPRGYIFSSLSELSKFLCDHIVPKVKVTNGRGQTLHGKLKCDPAFIEIIKALKSSSSIPHSDLATWWRVNCKHLSTSTSLKKRDGVQWYLIYYPAFELIGYAHFSRRYPNEVILAELTTESADFKATVGS